MQFSNWMQFSKPQWLVQISSKGKVQFAISENMIVFAKTFG